MKTENLAYIRWDDDQLKAAGIHKGKLKKLTLERTTTPILGRS
jgi:hypothetical protein